MKSMLLAGNAGFDLNHLASLVPKELTPDLQDKVGGIRLLVLKAKARFVAQIQACDEEEDEDTRQDLRRIKDPPAEFAQALEKGGLCFLIVTYAPEEQPSLQKAIDAFARAGVVQFDCSDDVRLLTA